MVPVAFQLVGVAWKAWKALVLYSPNLTGQNGLQGGAEVDKAQAFVLLLVCERALASPGRSQLAVGLASWALSIALLRVLLSPSSPRSLFWSFLH